MANTELGERIQWSVLAQHIPGKTGSHLRWRWNAIRPDRSMRPWTSEEDSCILDFQREHGNKWLECAKAVSSVRGLGGLDVDNSLVGFARDFASGSPVRRLLTQLSSLPSHSIASRSDQLRLQEPLRPAREVLESPHGGIPEPPQPGGRKSGEEPREDHR